MKLARKEHSKYKSTSQHSLFWQKVGMTQKHESLDLNFLSLPNGIEKTEKGPNLITLRLKS